MENSGGSAADKSAEQTTVTKEASDLGNQIIACLPSVSILEDCQDKKSREQYMRENVAEAVSRLGKTCTLRIVAAKNTAQDVSTASDVNKAFNELTPAGSTELRPSLPRIHPEFSLNGNIAILLMTGVSDPRFDLAEYLGELAKKGVRVKIFQVGCDSSARELLRYIQGFKNGVEAMTMDDYQDQPSLDTLLVEFLKG